MCVLCDSERIVRVVTKLPLTASGEEEEDIFDREQDSFDREDIFEREERRILALMASHDIAGMPVCPIAEWCYACLVLCA